MHDQSFIHGRVVAELRGADGGLKGYCEAENVITNIGDQVYAEQGSGIGSPAAKPTGAKLGSGSTAVAKSGSGSALTIYLSNSHQAITGGYPTSALNAGKRDIVYQYLWAAGKATTASPITEAVIVNNTLADATSTEAQTLSRVLLYGIASKAAGDTLTLTWTHTIGT